MITPGLAYSIGYEPYRLALAHAVAELLERLARDPRIMANPKLKHAIEFASRGAKIEQTVAAEKANALIARAAAKNIALPELPTSVKQWAAWVASLADHIAPMLPGREAAVAFEAGTVAAALMVQWGLAEKLAYLRAADPEQPELAAEAASTAQKIAALRERLAATLASVQRPLVARKLDWIEQRLHRAPRPDATSSKTYSSNYAHIADWQKLVDTLLSSLDADFDAPLATHPTSEPTADEQRLFAEILERPDDDELRRRYAELAAKRLDPRAELIREQLAIRDLEARGELVLGRHPQRVEELIVSHPEWTAPLTELGARDVKFDRGFPSEITIDVGDFLAHAPRLFERAPITSVHLRGGLAGRGAALARLPQLAKLTALDLLEQGVTDADLSALASSPYVSRLRSLNLAENRLTEAGIESLAASTRLPALEHVALDLNPGGNPVDQLRYYDETHQEPVPTEAGLALEQKYGTLRWLHPYRRE